MHVDVLQLEWLAARHSHIANKRLPEGLTASHWEILPEVLTASHWEILPLTF